MLIEFSQTGPYEHESLPGMQLQCVEGKQVDLDDHVAELLIADSMAVAVDDTPEDGEE